MRILGVVFAVVFVLASLAQAESRIACWDIYTKAGTRPVVTAQIGENNRFSKLTLNVKESEWFAGYFTNDSDDKGYARFSELKSPLEEVPAQIVTSNHSPY